MDDPTAAVRTLSIKLSEAADALSDEQLDRETATIQDLLRWARHTQDSDMESALAIMLTAYEQAARTRRMTRA